MLSTGNQPSQVHIAYCVLLLVGSGSNLSSNPLLCSFGSIPSGGCVRLRQWFKSYFSFQNSALLLWACPTLHSWDVNPRLVWAMHILRGFLFPALSFLGFSPRSLSSSCQVLWPKGLGFFWSFLSLSHHHSCSSVTRVRSWSKVKGRKREENNGTSFPSSSGQKNGVQSFHCTMASATQLHGWGLLSG